jgi:hypothetical protein
VGEGAIEIPRPCPRQQGPAMTKFNSDETKEQSKQETHGRKEGKKGKGWVLMQPWIHSSLLLLINV